MSLCSSLTPSILKKTSTLQERLKISSSVNKVRFVLPHSKNVSNILRNFLKHENVRDYENLICLIRDSELLDEDLSSLLEEATQCISLMGSQMRLFLDVLLSVRWADRGDKLVNNYQSFLVNLLAAHNYHAKVVIDHLISLFIPSPNEEPWENGVPSDSDCLKCANVHSVLNTLFKIVPMCKDIFLNSLITQYPYFKRGAHINEYYLHNLLWILDYQPWFSANIFHLIFSKLVLMDVNVPKEFIQQAYAGDEEEMFPMDDTRTIKSTTSLVSNNVIVDTLDICLDRLFSYLINECHNSKTQELDWDKTKEIYKHLTKIFDEIILPTYNSHHIQFCWFVLCGFKLTIAEAFLDHLWKKVINPNVPAVLRQSSVEYMASLVARASYITLKMMKFILEQLATWIHSYINTQDGLECVNSDLRIHSVFYSVCQALFYLTTFRHREMIGSKKNMAFLQNLNFTKIVTSRLNPLKVCQPAVVQNFAAFTRNYQLAYCYSIIEHNSRNMMPTIYQNEKGTVVQMNAVLETKYPFDPFVLKRSGEKIRPFYREYEEMDLNTIGDHNVVKDSEMTEVDDFLDQNVDTSKCTQFSYGTSPGFKFNLH
ncbi:hypothetical protein WA026_021414 [Henosepilachna vigintioctopunctata]|uniref:RNA polymerase I-specific transcription initiation factor RRN3 n=1 Tax=Henosepilachna vigintioctopunctata TaxID=420089 RepID=A0AAW1TZN3_9CUCU